MSSVYERWQVSLLIQSLPSTPLGKHSARVTSPKDIYMVDLPQLSNLVFSVHCCSDCPLCFILKEFDNLIWVCVGRGASLGEHLALYMWVQGCLWLSNYSRSSLYQIFSGLFPSCPLVRTFDESNWEWKHGSSMSIVLCSSSRCRRVSIFVLCKEM